MCNNINYWAKNRVVMFYCGLQSIARFISTRPTSTRIGWRVKENFPETFYLSCKKVKMLFTGLGQSVL